MAAPTDLGAPVHRPLILASGVAAALLALYSCSLQASLTTDGEGRIVDVSSLRIESSLSRWTIEMLIVAGQLAFELRWTPPTSQHTRMRIECPDGLIPAPAILAQVA
jgi:hypothetical protein